MLDKLYVSIFAPDKFSPEKEEPVEKSPHCRVFLLRQR